MGWAEWLLVVILIVCGILTIVVIYLILHDEHKRSRHKKHFFRFNQPVVSAENQDSKHINHLHSHHEAAISTNSEDLIRFVAALGGSANVVNILQIHNNEIQIEVIDITACETHALDHCIYLTNWTSKKNIFTFTLTKKFTDSFLHRLTLITGLPIKTLHKLHPHNNKKEHSTSELSKVKVD